MVLFCMFQHRQVFQDGIWDGWFFAEKRTRAQRDSKGSFKRICSTNRPYIAYIWRLVANMIPSSQIHVMYVYLCMTIRLLDSTPHRSSNPQRWKPISWNRMVFAVLSAMFVVKPKTDVIHMSCFPNFQESCCEVTVHISRFKSQFQCLFMPLWSRDFGLKLHSGLQ